MSGQTTTRAGRKALTAAPRTAVADPATWLGRYLHAVVAVDGACALAGGLAALVIRFEDPGLGRVPYLIFTLSLPVLWCLSVALAGGYDARMVGLGSDEFRRVFNAAVSLTAGIAIVSYITKGDIARSYVLIALPCATALDLTARYALRKRLHRRRRSGAFMRRVIAVGHPDGVTDLITELRREPHHGLAVVGACLTAGADQTQVAAVPVCGGLERVQSAVSDLAADTVAVLACPELNGTRLRELAWQLEKTGTDLCVAPAVLDVAGPRTTIRPVAGMPLLHVDHPELTGFRWVIKGVFDRVSAAAALIALAPLLAAHRAGDQARRRRPRDLPADPRGQGRAPVHGLQVPHDGGGRGAAQGRARWRTTTVMGCCSRCATTRGSPAWAGGCASTPWTSCPNYGTCSRGTCRSSARGPRCPRKPTCTATTCGAGSSSSRGSPACGRSAARSDLPWDEAVRLDLRYVENWSLVLDLQILWKTSAAVFKGSGAY